MKLRDAVFHAPSFEKEAAHDLDTDTMSWSEDILKKFYSDVDYIPKELGVDIVVDDINENKGYAKGSVVVFYQGKRVNYPVIVKDFKLSPFDVFVHNDDYYQSNYSNLKKILSSETMGGVENISNRGASHGIKTPGGIDPKETINLEDQSADQAYPGLRKMSGWVRRAKKEDIEKLAVQIESNPDVAASFVGNSGDLISKIVETKDDLVTPNDHKEGKLDLKDVVKAKQAVTIIDADMFDVNQLRPVKPPSVCELRMNEYPSMEDFMESGQNMSGRYLASSVGKSVIGVVLDLNRPPMSNVVSFNDEGKRRDQVFISACGCYYSVYSDYNKTGVGFYGLNIIEMKNSVEKAVGIIREKTTNDFTNFNKDNYNDGADKAFISIGVSEKGKGNRGGNFPISYNCGSILVVYGAGESYEAMEFSGKFKKYTVNGTKVFVSDEAAIVPANVANIQKVSSIEDPVYRTVIGDKINVFLVPESALCINLSDLKRVDPDSFLTPDKPVRDSFEKVSHIKVGLTDSHDYEISGEAIEPLKKISGLNRFSTKEALFSLQTVGMDKFAASRALKIAINKFASDEEDRYVRIYGVRDDYINQNAFDGIEKKARVNGLMKEFAYSIRKDLVKEASVIKDPEAVDVVLSLNFINEDSIKEYIDSISKMKNVSSKLAKMLVASRMGLSDIDESAVKRSLTGLEDVIKSLESMKMVMNDA